MRPSLTMTNERSKSKKSEAMKALTLVTAALIIGVIALSASTAVTGGRAEAAAAQASSSPASSTASNQAGAAEAAPLRVMVGKSLLINTPVKLKRVSVTDPAVADALVVTPTQILINGLAPGEVSLLIWDEFERSQSFDLRVDVDISAASEEMHRLFPGEQI